MRNHYNSRCSCDVTNINYRYFHILHMWQINANHFLKIIGGS